MPDIKSEIPSKVSEETQKKADDAKKLADQKAEEAKKQADDAKAQGAQKIEDAKKLVEKNKEEAKKQALAAEEQARAQADIYMKMADDNLAKAEQFYKTLTKGKTPEEIKIEQKKNELEAKQKILEKEIPVKAKLAMSNPLGLLLMEAKTAAINQLKDAKEKAISMKDDLKNIAAEKIKTEREKADVLKKQQLDNAQKFNKK